MYFKFLIS